MNVTRRLLRRLAAVGLRGTATAARPAHPAVNTGSGPLMGADMEITLPGMRPLRTVVTDHPDLIAPALMDPGMVLRILADPQDPRRVIIDRTRTGEPDGSGVRTSCVSRGRPKGRSSELLPAAPGCR